MENDNLYKKRHSLSHLLAYAVKELYPDAKLSIGPAIDNGFYYDIDFGEIKISDTDLKAIEKKMTHFAKQNLDFVRNEKDIETGLQEARQSGNTYKTELIADLKAAGETAVSYYRVGEFVDLCKGPHVDNTKEIKPGSFCLDKLAGAYWRGDEKNRMLTRIYGLAFDTKEELDAYRQQLEEAKKRDHRKLGRDLGLFTVSSLVGAGLPLLQPKGMIVRQEIEKLLWELHKDQGYLRVWTPHIAKEDLYITSGHAAKFGDELFRVSGKEENFILKPMNCPHHMQIFADNQFSYRQMPVRYFEPATVYRDEKSGQLGGLTRVRAITQDDGHLFCRISQIGEEVSAIVAIIKRFYTIFGMMDNYWVSLSVRGDDRDKYLGSDQAWEAAESALEKSAKENGLNYRRVEGEAAFYGPKLDFMFKDAIGRQWQLATIQCDFNLPERFDLSFANEQGEKERPVVIHRAISGSLERFMGMIIEHFSGAFPLWLSPVQVKVLCVGESHQAAGQKLVEQFQAVDIRAELDDSDETVGNKTRKAINEKVPYILVMGDKEIESGQVAVRTALDRQIREMDKDKFLGIVTSDIKSRALKLSIGTEG